VRTSFLLPLFLLATTAASQPYFDRNYCGFAPNDSIDITNDGIPDLVVLGARSGTDDEPSSSGNCYLYVMNLPGTTILNIRDDQGHWRTAVFAKGDSIPSGPVRPQVDLRIPKEKYTDGSIPVAYWGYGHRSALITMTPNLRTQHYVFQTMRNGTGWHGSFTVEPSTRMDHVAINMGAFVPSDQSFIVR